MQYVHTYMYIPSGRSPTPQLDTRGAGIAEPRTPGIPSDPWLSPAGKSLLHNNNISAYIGRRRRSQIASKSV